jgi:hypothetical protein
MSSIFQKSVDTFVAMRPLGSFPRFKQNLSSGPPAIPSYPHKDHNWLLEENRKTVL